MQRIRAVAAALAGAEQPRDVLALLADHGADIVGAEFASVAVPRDDATLALQEVRRFDDATIKRWRTIPVDADVPPARAFRTGEMFVAGDRDELLSEFPALETELETTERQAWACLPLVTSGVTQAVVNLAWRHPRAFDPETHDLLDTIAAVGAQALSRAMAEEDRQQLLRRVESIADTERRRLANRVHDDAIQLIGSANLRLGSLRLDGGAPELADVEELLRRAVRDLRSLIVELRAFDATEQSLAEALRSYCEHTFVGSDLSVQIDASIDESIPRDAEDALYRIVTEALTNARRHAGATRVGVTIREAGGGVEAVIRDDGRGITEAEQRRVRPDHLGLSSMSDRARSVMGRLTIEGSSNLDGARSGTTVRVWIPTPRRQGRPDQSDDQPGGSTGGEEAALAGGADRSTS